MEPKGITTAPGVGRFFGRHLFKRTSISIGVANYSFLNEVSQACLGSQLSVKNRKSN
jgi:hypothetical protein